MIKNLVFDFDGTIADSRYLAIDLINQLAVKYGFRKVKEDELEHFRSMTLMERCRAVHVPVYLIPVIYVELKNSYKQNIKQLNIYSGLKKVLSSLKQKGFNLSIISSNSVSVISDFCKKNEIDFFDIYSSRTYLGKEIAINSFLKKYNLAAKDIVYIGDECRDIAACKKINVKIISVTWGFESFELLSAAKPDYIAENPGELLKIINNKI